MVKRPDRNAREQRQLRRDYEARQAVHTAQVRRRSRDNWIAGIATVVVCGAAILGQLAYFGWGPGAPAPVPTATDSPTPAATDSSLGTVQRDDTLTEPSVDLSTDPPTVTLPAADVAAPTQLVVEVLDPGTGGATVADGQTVTIDYHGVNWTTAAIFDSSYLSGQPATFSLSGVIEGFKDALVGQAVGSTVLAILPSDLAYGDDSGDPNTSGPLVFVIHIISAQ